MDGILFANRYDWRNWLKQNHDIANNIWLIYYKKHTGKESVKQPEAVEEALCYGWIDSIVKTIDDEKYMQKFTPRSEKSIWSDVNKIRVKKLITNGQMTKYGLAKINIAKKNGMWDKIRNTTNLDLLPKELEVEILNNDIFNKIWTNLSPSHKKQYLYWINTAKKEETKVRRIRKTIDSLLNNERIGML